MLLQLMPSKGKVMNSIPGIKKKNTTQISQKVQYIRYQNLNDLFCWNRKNPILKFI